jgi:mycofactocin system glycosyltransferase
LDLNEAHIDGLAFRLRKAVAIHDRDGKLRLVLQSPLKSILLHASWRECYQSLSTGRFVPLAEISKLLPDLNLDQLELFLNDMVRRGFLEQRGVSSLTIYPSISIIIPVHNRPEDINQCLKSLSQLNYPADKLEIIVVDDASTDHTCEIISRFPVQLIKIKENRQAPFCRNLAARRAKGDILAFLDSDCLADDLWLRELVPAFKDSQLGVIGGKVDSYFNDVGLDRYEKVKSALNMGTWAKRSRKNNSFFYVPSCNMLVRKALFDDLSGFNESLVVGEDVDFCWRILKLGYDIEYRPVGTVFHKHRNRLIPFCRRRFDYGTSEPLLQQLHAEKIKQLVFPPFKTLFWLVAIMALLTGYLPLLLVGAIIVLVDGFKTYRQCSLLHIRPLTVFKAVLRGYFSFLYHCGAFVSRYYLAVSLLLGMVWPMIAAVAISLHLIPCIVEFWIKKPQLNPIAFVFYFTLEQLSYQLGVWWGCFRYRCFAPVAPRIVSQIPA